MSEALLRDPDWAVIFADARAILFARRAGALERFARARGSPPAPGTRTSWPSPRALRGERGTATG